MARKGPQPKYGTTMSSQMKFSLTPEQRAVIDKYSQEFGINSTDFWRETMVNIAQTAVITGAVDITVNLKTHEAKPADET